MNNTLSKNIVSLRKQKKITRFKLAVLSGVSPEYLYRLETGKTTNVGVDILYKIASAFDVEVYELLPPRQAA